METLKGKNVPIKLWANVHEVESAALTQLKNIAALPWCFNHIAVMPDVHLGKGATVGSVIAMKDAVSPAAVGVDIGCGMMSAKTSLTASRLPDNLGNIRSRIEQEIPSGFHARAKAHPELKRSHTQLFERFKSLHEKVQDLEGRALLQCGTLGGGNHFIEICLDTEDQVWVMLHSGSRNIGKTLAEIHIQIAKKLTHNTTLPDRELSVFLAGTPEMQAYRNDLMWAQEYAWVNRQIMFAALVDVLREFWPGLKHDEPVACHHNYVAEEVHFGEHVFVTRKGAINAEAGRMGIIPGSMGTCSYIVRGKGNPESFNSASHGAGRRMSRSEAKRRFTLDDLVEQTNGVECAKERGLIDEIPAAYKSIDKVMEQQRDLVEVVAQLKQVLCVKGVDDPPRWKKSRRDHDRG